MFLLGFFMAEGSLSAHNGIRLAIGKRNQARLAELIAAFEEVFGLSPTLYESEERAPELRLLNRVAALFFQSLFGSGKMDAAHKRIPDLVFNVSRELQLAFLRGYFLGDGALGKQSISFTTVSESLANQLMYLFLAHGVHTSLSRREPNGRPGGMIRGKPVITRQTTYTLTVSGRDGVAQCEPIWRDHQHADRLQAWLVSPQRKGGPRPAAPLAGDLIGLPVRAVRLIPPSERKVYDFSVEADETFICGVGGLCCHNTDADVDGSHIRTLLLTFFFRYMPALIEQGHLFIAQPPLYRVAYKNSIKYAYSDGEKDKMVKEVGDKAGVQCYKGLGEMNPEQLWETTMNPENRTLLEVTVDDAAEADRTFDMLMGDEVAPRKKFIQTHAKTVRNLDI